MVGRETSLTITTNPGGSQEHDVSTVNEYSAGFTHCTVFSTKSCTPAQLSEFHPTDAGKKGKAYAFAPVLAGKHAYNKN